MRENRTQGSARAALRNGGIYRDALKGKSFHSHIVNLRVNKSPWLEKFYFMKQRRGKSPSSSSSTNLTGSKSRKSHGHYNWLKIKKLSRQNFSRKWSTPMSYGKFESPQDQIYSDYLDFLME